MENITITVLISASGHVVVAGIYNYLLHYHSMFPLSSANTSVGCGSLSGSLTKSLFLKNVGLEQSCKN